MENNMNYNNTFNYENDGKCHPPKPPMNADTHSSRGTSLFCDTVFLLHGSFPNSGPTKNQITDLLRCGRGVVCANVPHFYNIKESSPNFLAERNKVSGFFFFLSFILFLSFISFPSCFFIFYISFLFLFHFLSFLLYLSCHSCLSFLLTSFIFYFPSSSFLLIILIHNFHSDRYLHRQVVGTYLPRKFLRKSF